jgi:hypothetical protein
MLDHVQIIKDNDQARFAVIPYEDYVFLRQLLTDREKLADYLDYLHVQSVKSQNPPRLSLADAKAALALD